MCLVWACVYLKRKGVVIKQIYFPIVSVFIKWLLVEASTSLSRAHPARQLRLLHTLQSMSRLSTSPLINREHCGHAHTYPSEVILHPRWLMSTITSEPPGTLGSLPNASICPIPRGVKNSLSYGYQVFLFPEIQHQSSQWQSPPCDNCLWSLTLSRICTRKFLAKWRGYEVSYNVSPRLLFKSQINTVPWHYAKRKFALYFLY